MQHIALEGRVFVLSACQYLTQDDFPADHPIDFEASDDGVLLGGGSVIIAPSGEVLAGPVFNAENFLYADIDLEGKTKGRLNFDHVGHYARPDAFSLSVNTRPQDSARFTK